jgi:glycosyltransferase involved in cell wall biosynthesis
MKLSILIATLESRDALREALEKKIQEQDDKGEVQILVSRDAGQCKIGAKRQSLLNAAKGEFIVFVDDDDDVSDDYVPSILEHCKKGVDCIGFLIDCHGYVKGKPMELETAIVSNRYDKWEENVDGFRYVRHTHHLVPVRREHALKIGFDPTSKYGEDYAYSMGLKRSGLLKTEAFIDNVLYTIRHNPNKAFGQ